MRKLGLLQLVAAVGSLAAGGSEDLRQPCADDNVVWTTLQVFGDVTKT